MRIKKNGTYSGFQKYIPKFQMLFEQNIASNVTRNAEAQTYIKQKTQARPSNYWEHMKTF